jgi:phosphatidylglycerophosphate synthase
VAGAADPDALASVVRDRLHRVASLPSGEEVSRGLGELVLHVRTPDDVGRAERTLRRSVVKPTDGTVARFNRRLSIPLSVALARTPLTANQLSAALVAVGCVAGWCLSLGTYGATVSGAALALAASILDGCDGEIARLKYQESALGCWLETIGDYAFYAVIFTGLTIGVARQTGAPVFLWIGSAGLGGTILSSALLLYLRRRITGGEPQRLHAIAKARYAAHPSWWSRVTSRLAVAATRAVMPYGILALALLDLAPVVVVLSAVGANAYWMSLAARFRDLNRIEPNRPAVSGSGFPVSR